jgi:hypothetical protein
MIFVLELPAAADPRAWFAFDAADLLRKLAAIDLPRLRQVREQLGDECEPAELAAAALHTRGDCRIYWTESEATAAFERTNDPAWQGPGWRARWALRDQLVALDVLADDL